MSASRRWTALLTRAGQRSYCVQNGASRRRATMSAKRCLSGGSDSGVHNMRDADRAGGVRLAVFGACGAAVAVASTVATPSGMNGAVLNENQPERLFNWSATQSCLPQRVLRPESHEEVAAELKTFATDGRKLRVMGSGLSPNGLAFSNETLLTLENMRRVLKMDVDKMQVTVEAGILVGELLEELAEHGMTLQNLASINSQQIGGFTQAGAHGTGASLPPVEEQVVAMTVATPGLGTVELSRNKNPDWFRLAKVGLGCFGVVTQVTLQCVPKHELVETIQVMTRAQVRDGHEEKLKCNRHVRYMWLPYTDSVVVVTSNPVTPEDKAPSGDGVCTANEAAHDTQPLIDLLLDSTKEYGPEHVQKRGFGELRDMLIAVDPHSRTHIERVNKAELAFWCNYAKARSAPEDSADVLGFDCGGQQLVLEVALPCGSQQEPDGRDLDFMDALLAAVEADPTLAAPAPIEQRWTCGSSAAMSPAGCDQRNVSRERLFSWVGIIMYLPTAEPDARARIQNSFEDYTKLLRDVDNAGQFGTKTHWAKIQVPRTAEELAAMRTKLAEQYPLEEWNKARALFDPNHAMSNHLVDTFISENLTRQ